MYNLLFLAALMPFLGRVHSANCDQATNATVFNLCNQLICTTPWSSTLVAGTTGYLTSVLSEYCGTGPSQINGVCGTCIASTGPGPAENCCVVQDPANCFNKWAQTKSDCMMYSNGTSSSASGSPGSTAAVSQTASATAKTSSTSKSFAVPTAVVQKIRPLLLSVGAVLLV